MNDTPKGSRNIIAGSANISNLDIYWSVPRCKKISSQFMQNIWWWYNCLEITREFYTQLYVDCSGIRLAVRKMCRTWNTLCHILFCRKRSILRVVCAVVCRLLWHQAGSQEDVSARSNNGSVTTSRCKCKNRKVDSM